ncbi:HIT family protein [Methylobacter luteus]|uniref:hypothetical protein n=1 Tax=Methylobacter luteus TaxID=415 RepID=UPI0038B2F51E
MICKKLADYFKTASGAQGFNPLNANEAVAQQSVMHLHFYFLPRHSDDAIDAWPVLPGANQYVRKSGNPCSQSVRLQAALADSLRAVALRRLLTSTLGTVKHAPLVFTSQIS